MKSATVSLLFCTCGASWVQDEALHSRAAQKVGMPPKKLVVDLDEAPEKRWAFIAKDPVFANYKTDFTAYLSKFIPKAAIPVVASIVKNLRVSFYKDYADEMEGLATALGVSLGDVVAANLIYQLEDIGVTCDKRNTTGPCPPSKSSSPGLCTGVVVDDGKQVFEGRNLDWNLDASLLKYVMQVEYRRQNRTVFIGAQVAGQVGVLHGLTQSGGFSAQINARNTGGNVLANLATLLTGAKTPTHVLRRALEMEDSFESGVKFLSSERLANPVYYIVAGAGHGEGAILTRERKDLVDAWHLYETPSKDTKKVNIQPDWLRLQTNYDHWQAVPSYDDRRTPGVANVKQGCGSGDAVNQDCVWKAITTWPTFNHHTDISAVMCPGTGYFNMTVWQDTASLMVIT
jgi:hypothetical protein